MEGHLLNIYGALFLAVSWGIVIWLNIFSFSKILSKNNKS
ncbi:hypothetical protein CLV39_1085 [Hydrogenothermus marinus]|uniref:CcmD family protein n=1 Tax=Hydrogenothermus marinus TaxID=133270 RepID=A0A3M0BI76_9AQUI|nr:hypothetical protein CLV39_1085 [Hydrogenothermus marinus]